MPDTEKYGVEEDADGLLRTAMQTKKCPVCNGPLRPREVTGVLLCVKCGSSPFETPPVIDDAKHR